MKNAILLILVLALTVCAVACAKKNDGASTEGGTTATGFGVTVNGTAVELGKDAAPVLAALGTPTLSQEVFDCGEGNSRMFYRFGSLELYTMKSDGKEIIDQIELNDDLVSTDKGICIGDTVEKVKTAYGEPQRGDEDDLVYVSGNQELTFEIDDGRVEEIGLLRVTR